jgi:putative heme-binding domain-containing protein
MYTTYAGARRTLGSVSPGSYPKFCSLEIIYSQQFPDDWQGQMITCDFRANRVVRFSIEEQGSAYVTKEMPLFIRTTNVTFRPIDVKLGPDGALYIADWSNPIIQHGEVDFRDPRRDRVHGRIWRVTFKGRPPVQKPQLASASGPELLAQLLSPNSFNRQQARRVLAERGDKSLTDLRTWSGTLTGERAQLEALWMFQTLNIPQPALLTELLKAQDPRIRAAATRVLSYWHKSVKDPLQLLAARIADVHPRVRLEAARALARIPSARSAELVLSALERPLDPHLEYALWLSINDLAHPWAAAVESGAWNPAGRQKQLEYGLKAIEPALASQLLARVMKDIPRDGAGGMIELAGQAAGPAQLRQLYDQVLNSGFDDGATARALAALGEAARLRNARPSGDLAGISRLLESSNEKVRAASIRLAGIWRISAATPLLLRVAEASNSLPGVRQAAFDGLRDIGGKEATDGLRVLSRAPNNDQTRRMAALALAGIDLKGSVDQVLEAAALAQTEEQSLGFWRALLNNKGAAPALTRGLAKAKLPETSARAGLRAAREGGRTEPDLILALARAGGLSDESQNLTEEELHRIAYNVPHGDAARGEAVYRRKELACLTCHSIGGAGGKVGPDMTSLGASAVLDYIVESVIAPNKKVKEGFNSIQVATKDGLELSGILVRENSEELVLRDAANKEVSIPKKNIETRKLGGSLMPAGLADILTESERLDLFRFLSELGKPGPFDASKGNVARVWRINSTKGVASDPNAFGGEVTNPAWTPLYANVNGSLLKQDLLAEPGAAQREEPILAATRFQSSRAGKVKLKLAGLNSPKAWLDGKPVGGDAEINADLPAGAHTLVLKIDPRQLPESIKLESPDVSFLVD